MGWLWGSGLRDAETDMLLTAIPTPAGVGLEAKSNDAGFAPASESPVSPLLLPSSSDVDLTDQNSSTSETLGAIWGPGDSERLYGVKQWGHPYFMVNDAGQLCVRPKGGELEQTLLHFSPVVPEYFEGL